MNVDKLMVVKTLKLGNGSMVMPGTVFPNHEFSEIPREIMLEWRKGRDTVKPIQLSAPKPVVVEEALQVVSEAIQPTLPHHPAIPPETVETPPTEQITAVSEPPEQPEPPAPKPKVKRTRKPITTK